MWEVQLAHTVLIGEGGERKNKNAIFHGNNYYDYQGWLMDGRQETGETRLVSFIACFKKGRKAVTVLTF